MTDLIKEGGRTSIPTKASRVTFFEDRAEVSRSAKVQVAKGAHWVSLAGVSVAVDDASVVARARGEEVRTLGSRVLRKIREEPAESPDRIAQLEEELRRAQREHNSLLQNLEVCPRPGDSPRPDARGNQRRFVASSAGRRPLVKHAQCPRTSGQGIDQGAR